MLIVLTKLHLDLNLSLALMELNVDVEILLKNALLLLKLLLVYGQLIINHIQLDLPPELQEQPEVHQLQLINHLIKLHSVDHTDGIVSISLKDIVLTSVLIILVEMLVKMDFVPGMLILMKDLVVEILLVMELNLVTLHLIVEVLIHGFAQSTLVVELVEFVYLFVLNKFNVKLNYSVLFSN